MISRFEFVNQQAILLAMILICAIVGSVFFWVPSALLGGKRRSLEFSVAGILGLTAIVALLIVWKVLAIIELAAFFYCTESLTRNLPTSIRNRIEINCHRKDGRRSSKRTRAEMRAIQKLRWNLYTSFGMVFVVSNVMLWFINDEVIPLSIGLDAITSFRMSETTWKESLRDEERRFEWWAETNQHSSREIETRKRLLWNSWPLLVIGALAWTVACFLFLKAAYFQSVKELCASIESRALQYAHWDSPRRKRAQCPTHTD